MGDLQRIGAVSRHLPRQGYDVQNRMQLNSESNCACRRYERYPQT
jgi:hypothetical protein